MGFVIITVYCPSCSGELTSFDKFCEKCGKEISPELFKDLGDKLKLYQFVIFPSILFLILVNVLWNQIKANLTIIANIIIITMVFLIILIGINYKDYSYRKFLYFCYFVGTIYSLLLFNVLGFILAIIGLYFASPNSTNIDTSVKEETESKSKERYIINIAGKNTK